MSKIEDIVDEFKKLKQNKRTRQKRRKNMSLIQMNAEQMRRKAIENAKAKQQQQTDFKNKVDSMSRHDVGSLYDVRAIMKSKQFKEQKNFYDNHQAEEEFRICFKVMECILKQMRIDYLKKTGRDQNAIDSFQLEELGKNYQIHLRTLNKTHT